MQIFLTCPKPIPTDTTLVVEAHKSTQISLNLDSHRYVLVRRMGRFFGRTNKDVLIDLIGLWVEHNIDMFPADERESIKELLEFRREGHTISNRKPQ